MKFGLFGTARTSEDHLAGANDSQAYREFIDYICEAEDLGFASVFLAEHHFTGINQISASIGLLTYLAAKTKRIRLGTGVAVLPWHNPVLLAEQAATLDILSNGRLDFGVGRGYRENEFKSFCIDIDEANERFEEALEIITKAWTAKGRFSHHGKRWNFEDIVVEPSPLQTPHPPFWVGATSAASVRRAGEMGMKLLLTPLLSLEEIIALTKSYHEAWNARRPNAADSSPAVVRALHVANSPREVDEGYEIAARFLLAANSLAGQRGTTNIKIPDSRQKNRDTLQPAALIGSSEQMIERLKILQAGGVDHVLLMNLSGSRQMLRTFAREVMPALADHALNSKAS